MTAESRLSFRRFHCICNESKRLCLQQQKLRQKGNTFSKKDQVNLNLKSLFLYHIFRMRALVSGLGARPTLPTRLSWAESFCAFMSDACWGWLRQLKGPPCKSSLPSGGKRIDVIWSERQRTPVVSHGLQELRTVNSPLTLLLRSGQQSLLQAHGERSGGSQPAGQYQGLILVITPGAGH